MPRTLWSSCSHSGKLLCSWDEPTVEISHKRPFGSVEEGVDVGKGAAAARCKPLKLHDDAAAVAETAETDRRQGGGSKQVGEPIKSRQNYFDQTPQ